ncbi:MAG: hypothetical protein U9Q82_07800 [Chloroflexota bacterium]|nr:hypothetical protein [Chloroflexota bacterium]
MKKFLLLDMDGVLLEPRGYHRALQETVRVVGDALGYRDTTITPEDITAFEVAGITSEWDSAAICAVMMLIPLWERFPNLTLPEDIRRWQRPRHALSPPEWVAVLGQLNQPPRESDAPGLRIEKLLGDGLAQKEIVDQILRDAAQIEGSLTHRIFQEFVLGSEIFTKTYGLDAWFETESYLQKYDRPMLADTQRDELLAWLAHPEQRAAIFTNRPSQPPPGCFGTPEAEIGARCVGLEMLPIVGFGDMFWLGEILGVYGRGLRKPSPVHVLSAMLRGIGWPQEQALETAANFALCGSVDPVWREFDDTVFYVFEDTAAGLESAVATTKLLATLGLSSELHLLGVTDSPSKKAALEAVGAVVFPNLGAAFETVLFTDP